jgi:hypothetical protein
VTSQTGWLEPQPGHRLQMDVKFLERIPEFTLDKEVLRELLSKNF